MFLKPHPLPVRNISRKGPWKLQIPRLRSYDTAVAGDRFCAAPTALRSSSGSISQPFRAGLTFGGRPSGPCIYSDLRCVIPPST